MNESARRGKRLGLKFALVQLACASVAAVVCLALGGLNAARSAVVGGLIIAAGTLVFASRMFASAWPAVNAAQGLYLGEALKWVWVVGALWLALTWGGFESLALLIGLIAAQFGFWLAIWIFR